MIKISFINKILLIQIFFYNKCKKLLWFSCVRQLTFNFLEIFFECLQMELWGTMFSVENNTYTIYSTLAFPTQSICVLVHISNVIFIPSCIDLWTCFYVENQFIFHVINRKYFQIFSKFRCSRHWSYFAILYRCILFLSPNHLWCKNFYF